MRDQCIEAAGKFLGRDLNRSETRGIEDRVKLNMRLLAQKDPQAWGKLPPADRVTQGAQAAAKQMIAELRKEQQRVQLTIAAHDRIDTFLKSQQYAKPGDRLAAVSRLLDWDTRGGGYTSVASWNHSLQQEFFSKLIGTLESTHPKFFGLLEDRAGVRALIKEMWGEDSGNPIAKQGAAIWKQTMSDLRDRGNAAGMNIGELEDWHFPQSHSRERLGAAGLPKWLDDTVPLLDRRKYLNLDGSLMTDPQVREFLTHAYDSIITDGMNKQEPGQRQGYGLTSDRNAAHRQIFFNDSDSYLTYQGLYGDKSLWNTLTGHVRRLARDVALTERMGPNSDQTFALFNDQAHLAEQRAFPTKAAKLRKQSMLNQALFDYVSGRQAVVNQVLANHFQAFRNLETAAKLGKVVITALSDESGMAATAFANKVPWAAAFMRELRTLNPADKTDRRVAEEAHLGLNSMVGGLNRFGSEEFDASWTGKLANAVMHMSGAERMWDARRQGLGSVLMSHIGALTRSVQNFKDLNVADHGVLARKGVTEENWQVWRAAKPEDWGSGAHTVLTPKAIAAIPDTDLDKAIAPRLQGVKDEAAKQLGDLKKKDAQDQAWLAKRGADLSQWVKDQQAKVQARITKLGAAATTEQQALAARLSRLQENIEYALSLWKGERDVNVPGIRNPETVGFYGKGMLRGAGVEEGRTIEQMRGLQREMREIDAELGRQKMDLTEKLFDGFHARQGELQEFAQRVAQRAQRRAQVTQRIQNDLQPQIEGARADARRQATTQLMAHVLEEAGMGAMDTGPRQRVMLSFGTQKGTVQGELLRSALLFKSFAASMMTKHWGRASTMPTTGAKWAYMSRLIVAGTITAALGNQIRSLLAGQNPQNVLSPQFWGAALLRGGGLGFYGDFLYDELNSHDNTLIPSLAGPIGTTAEDMWNLSGAAAFKHAKGERTEELPNLVRFARSNIPLLNMWYTQAAMDHILWDSMQDAASPGYLDRMQAKAYNQKGTTWWWNPQETVPSQAPDLKQAFQPQRGRDQVRAIAQSTGIDSGP